MDDLTGFEITKFLELPQPYGIFAVWGVVLPAIFLLSTTLTNLVLKDGLILRVSLDSDFDLNLHNLRRLVELSPCVCNMLILLEGRSARKGWLA